MYVRTVIRTPAPAYAGARRGAKLLLIFFEADAGERVAGLARAGAERGGALGVLRRLRGVLRDGVAAAVEAAEHRARVGVAFRAELAEELHALRFHGAHVVLGRLGVGEDLGEVPARLADAG